MNVIGEIGNFIMRYQEPIQVAAIAILVVVGMICIGKVIADTAKRRRLLTQISETVTEINANVKSLRDKKTEVIYIDGRVTPENRTIAPELDEGAEAVAKPAETTQPQREEKETPEEHPNPVVKYFSRDCAVAKDGRQYTVEELDAQIRD